MTTPSFHDIEQLSAFLDKQLPQAQKTRLETRIKSDPAFATALGELRQSRNLLRRTPQRRAPHHFMLTPKMAGIKPPVPRLVPAFSWASAVAMLLFVLTLGINLIGQLPLGASAPMMAAAPADNTRSGYGSGGVPPAATSAPVLAAPATQAPVSTQVFVNGTEMATITAEAPIPTILEATTQSVTSVSKTASTLKIWKSAKFWVFVWLGLAALFIAVASLIRWSRYHAFAKRVRRE